MIYVFFPSIIEHEMFYLLRDGYFLHLTLTLISSISVNIGFKNLFHQPNFRKFNVLQLINAKWYTKYA